MKDFDFDELDRAVNSVLATKDTKTDAAADPATTDASQQAVQVADQPNDAVPVTVQTQTVEPREEHVEDLHDEAHEETNDVHTENDDAEESDDSVQVDVNSGSEDATETPDEEQDEVQVLNSDEQDELLEDGQDADEETESHDDHHGQADELAETADTDEANDTHAAALAAIPVKRGRFMDMVPGTGTSDNAKKPMPVRSGLTLTPSSDFVATGAQEDETDEDSHDASQTDVATPLIDSEVEPEVQTISVDEQSHDDSLSEQSDEEEHDEAKTEPITDADPTAVTSDVPAASAPFIPDVPVEKRPLNSLSGDTSELTDALKGENTENSDESSSVADPTLFANPPKEFDKDIMAVEANETVGEHNDTQNASNTPSDASALAINATGAEPHPMFDTSTLAHSGATAAHHTSKMSWAIVGVSLFIVGAALGVLYFLYGQG